MAPINKLNPNAEIWTPRWTTSISLGCMQLILTPQCHMTSSKEEETHSSPTIWCADELLEKFSRAQRYIFSHTVCLQNTKGWYFVNEMQSSHHYTWCIKQWNMAQIKNSTHFHSCATAQDVTPELIKKLLLPFGSTWEPISNQFRQNNHLIGLLFFPLADPTYTFSTFTWPRLSTNAHTLWRISEDFSEILGFCWKFGIAFKLSVCGPSRFYLNNPTLYFAIRHFAGKICRNDRQTRYKSWNCIVNSFSQYRPTAY